MIYFFSSGNGKVYAVGSTEELATVDLKKLEWLFGGAILMPTDNIKGFYTGPRKEMITPWSTNAVEITRNMGISSIFRIEEFLEAESRNASYDPMLQSLYDGLDSEIFHIDKEPEPVLYIDNIKEYNEKEGLALSDEEVKYLEEVSSRIGRKLTDSEIFGFSQVNSEHCRHKIFNGTFIIDGKEMPETLFTLIKRTSKEHPGRIVSAYKDNVAFIEGPAAEQFAPAVQDKPGFFEVKDIETVISLKAETHNFPTTVEPFNGAATGSGGEIRDRMAGGKGSIPLAGTAVYMTSYPRTEQNRSWEQFTTPRKWLYHNPQEILIKASNGASDFGNKFGQPLICGSLLTFEHFTSLKKYGYDKVIMLAGGVGFAKKKDSLKGHPEKDDLIIVMGGDNYRIGMGGGAVSSVATGEYDNAIELNAVQRSNPEMQKRVQNVIRALCEADENPIISIHDHGAGGHLNSLSELVEESGGRIDMAKLPIGDPTLSAKEIIGNESQERMGLLIKKKNLELLKRLSERERAPMYEVGKTTGDWRLIFEDTEKNIKPIDLDLADMFGKPPKTVLTDTTTVSSFEAPEYDMEHFHEYLAGLLQMEAVACKDWLTNKVDRSVTGKVVLQQTAGEIQLPLNNLGVMALDYKGEKGVATSIGHAPVAGLIDPEAGSVLSVAEALTNIIWAPIKDGLSGVSLSANWMWPAKNKGENARLYYAVKAVSDFAVELGINIPTGKDSLSMTQKYADETVFSPGTVIISTAGEVTDTTKILKPVLRNDSHSVLLYVDMSKDDYKLGGSTFGQMKGKIGSEAPTVKDAAYFALVFNTIQELIRGGYLHSGHDISAGGMITTLLEMTFANRNGGLDIDLTSIGEKDTVKLLFSENPGIIIQVSDKHEVISLLNQKGIEFYSIGYTMRERKVNLKNHSDELVLDINELRDNWFKSSYLLDRKQTQEFLSLERYRNYKEQPLKFSFPAGFTGKASQFDIDTGRRDKTGIKAAIIREKGINGDREMAYSLYLAGFDVKDVHMTDLITGREDLSDVNMIVFTGGFSNSDVLGSAKGWAGAFLYNAEAKKSLDNFYDRNDTLSLGICNGCQLMMELGLIYPGHKEKPAMQHNDSGKFESGFINVDIVENDTVMLKSLAGARLGVWVAHGEGKFGFPYDEGSYCIPVKYSYGKYPGNPNGSVFSAAAVASPDGRHLAMMPHIERAVFPWQWAHYPFGRKNDEITPWVEAFVNALKWIRENKSPA